LGEEAATMSDAPLNREQVLDKLEQLADVEHALIVENLTVSCALGHDLPPEEGGATSPEGHEAATTAASLAQAEMFHLKDICGALVDAGRTPQLGRASSIADAAGALVSLDPPSAADLRHLVEREKAIVDAVAAAYTALATSLTPDLFEEPLLGRLRGVVESGSAHRDGATRLSEALGTPPPPDFLRVPRRETTDPFELDLQRTSDLAYRLVTSALREQFAQPEVFTFRNLATTAMDALDASNRALARRGLLPAFTL
jgi:hypothetical protein